MLFFTALTSTCPTGVTETASATDYTVFLQVTFAPNILQMDVPVTINNDETEESTEIFCLTIPPADAGSQGSITIIIPENDCKSQCII